MRGSDDLFRCQDQRTCPLWRRLNLNGPWTNLRTIREYRGLDLEKLADLVGISYKEMSQLERGWRWPSGDDTYRLADALGVAVEHIARVQRH